MLRIYKKYLIHNKLRVYTKAQHNTNQISGQNYWVFSRFHVKTGYNMIVVILEL